MKISNSTKLRLVAMGLFVVISFFIWWFVQVALEGSVDAFMTGKTSVLRGVDVGGPVFNSK
jgi:hypothetical protein